MAVLTVRNVPDEVHRALRIRAAEHGHSMEAEAREILRAALVPSQRVRIGDSLAKLGRSSLSLMTMSLCLTQCGIEILQSH